MVAVRAAGNVLPYLRTSQTCSGVAVAAGVQQLGPGEVPACCSRVDAARFLQLLLLCPCLAVLLVRLQQSCTLEQCLTDPFDISLNVLQNLE